jgi:predicted RNA-binding Zn ribbon-like protein
MRPLDREGDATMIGDLVDRALTLKPAPEPLHHVQLLLNSRNLLAGYDLLADRETAMAWLAATTGGHATGADGQFDDADLTGLRHLREALRDVLAARATGRAPDPKCLRLLNAMGAATKLGVHFDGSGNPQLEPASASFGMQRVTDRVLAAWASAEPDRLRRLKACLNPECGWVFYDTSRSRSGTWCLMNVCGARHKMERYRSRLR